MSIVDVVAREIYGRAEHHQINSWLRTLTQIRQLPQGWPTR